MTKNLPFLLSFCYLLFGTSLNAQIVINEFSAANQDQYFDNYGGDSDWIELYNNGATAVDLAGYYLSDKIDNPTKFQIPTGVSLNPGSHILIWASGRDEFIGGVLHTNFKITQTKNSESVVLTGPLGTIIDFHLLDVANKNGHSWARTTDGASSWGIAYNPSPETTNNNVRDPYTDRPQISPAAGFYGANLPISITVDDPNASIFYTTNGQTPDQNSTLYTGPFNLNNTAVVKAIAIIIGEPNATPSFVDFNTYFINDTHTLPVVSVSGGDQLMTLMNGTYSSPTGTFELFEDTGERVSDATGEFNKHGNDSWAYNQRGIDYITRDEFGDDHAVKHAVFDPELSDRDEFQRLILKAAANDNYPYADGAHIRDSYVHTLSQLAGLEMDERTSENCILYVNGEYWGVYDLREKVDDHDYTKYYYNQGREWIDFLKTWGGTWAEYGSANDWNSLRNFIIANDMSNAANYATVESQLEVLSLIDYVILHSHNVSTDWLNWNTAWWKGNKPTGDAQKWRYALWDEDATFGHYINYTGVPDVTANADPCNPELLDDPGGQGHIPIFNALLNNQDFLNLYISRYADLNNSYFNCEFMINLLDEMIAKIEPEMPQQIARWGGSMSGWQENVQEMRDFINLRCTIISEGIVDCYEDLGITGPFNITIDVQPPGSGTVQANTIVGLNYPWNAEYFGGVDFDLTAIPNCGYSFSNWTVANHTFGPDQFSDAISMSLITDDVIIAYFQNDNTPITLEPIGPICESTPTVALNATPTGGTWTNIPDGLFNPSSYGIGTHNITYVYNYPNGCIDSNSMEIIVNENPTASISPETATYCSDDGGITLSATGTNGSGNYTYTWNTPSGMFSGFEHFANTPGQYILTIADDQSCEAYDTIEVNEVAFPLLELTNPGTLCSSTASFTLEANPIGGSWAGDITPNGEILPSDLGPGFYTFFYNYADQNGCAATDSLTINISDIPEAIATNDGPYCINQTITLFANTANTGTNISYDWTGPNSYSSTQQNPNNATEEGIYNLIINIDGCESTSVSTEVIINNSPSVNIIGDEIFCAGSSNILDAGDGFENYNWTGNIPGQIFEVNAPGTYSVTITDDNGCTAEDAIIISENPTLSIDMNFNAPDCNGDCNGTIDISVQGGSADYEYLWSNGSSSEDLNDLCFGTYTVTITDTVGCTIIGEYELAAPNGLSIDANISHVDCNLSCNGSIDLTVTGGQEPFTYLWDCGDSAAEDQNNLCAGICNVIVRDANGCEATASFIIEEPDELVAILSPESVSCEGECDGMVSLMVSGGIAPYEFLWSDFSTVCDLSQACTGSYSVIVTDVNGCTVQGFVDVDEPTAIEVTATISDPLCENICEGFVDIEINGGIAPYTFDWSNSSNNKDLENLCAGQYDLIVTDFNGCSSSRSFTIIEHPNPTPSISGALSFCSGGNTILDAGDGFPEYLWSNGSISQTVTISNSMSISVMVTDINGCTGMDEVSLIENGFLSPSITGVLEFCDGESTILDAGPNYETYQWSNGEMTQTISVSENGNYGVIVTDAAGCSGSENVTINIFDNPNPTIAGSTTFCSGSSTNLDAGDFSTYLWSTGEMTQTILVNTPGVYTVDIIDQNGCTGTASIEVNESSSITPVISGNFSFCSGSSTILNAGAGFSSYLWSNGSIDQTIEISEAGIYSVIVSDAQGCSGETSISISETTPPEAILENNMTICNTTAGGSIINLYNLILSGDQNGTWEDADQSGAVGLFDGLNFNAIPAGDYNFIYTTNSAVAPCDESSYSVTISVMDCSCPSVQFFQTDPLCNEDGILDLTTVENTLEAGTWSVIQNPTGNNPATINGNMFNAIGSDQGDYSLEFTLSDAQNPGCPTSFIIDISVDQAPNAGTSTDPTEFCAGSTSIVDLESLLINADPNGTWEETSTFPSQGNAFDPTNATFDPENQPGDFYSFRYTVSNNNSCNPDLTEVDIIINPLPNVVFTEPVLFLDCNNQVTTLDASNSSTGFNFEINWTGPGIVIDGNENTLSPNADQAGLYTLTINNTNTGCFTSNSIQVNDNSETPNAFAGDDQTLNCLIDNLNLQASGDIGFPFQILWEGPGIDVSNQDVSNPNISIPGIYTITITNPNNGCSATDFVEIFEDIVPPVVIIQSNLEELNCNTPNSDLIADSPTPNATFQWFDDQNNIIGNDAIINGITEAGIYTILVTGENGCTSTDFIEVVNNINYPNANAGNTELLNCFNTEINLNGSASQTGSDIIYLWEGPGISGPLDQALSTANLPGTYTLNVINTSNGCSSSDQVIITQDIEAPSVFLNPVEQLDCTLETVTLDGTGSSTGNQFTYSWLDANGSIIANDLVTDIQNPGNYTLNIFNTNNGCENSEAILVTQNSNIPNAVTFTQYDPDCFGDVNGFLEINSISGGVEPYVYALNGSDFSTNPIYSNLAPGTYELLIQDSNGCELFETITINPGTEVTIDLGGDQDLELGDSVIVEAFVNIPTDLIDTIIWNSPTSINCIDENCLEIGLNTFSSIQIAATLIDSNGCTDYEQITINMKKSRNVFIPNVFSPDGDGYNDLFMINANERQIVNISTFRIFNRWGEIVHEKFNVQPNDSSAAWDGHFKGKAMNSGVFIYSAEIEFIDGRKQLYKGDLTLLK